MTANWRHTPARTPDEILDDLDSFAGTQEELAQLRGLMWEVIEDLIDTLDDLMGPLLVDIEPGKRTEIVESMKDYVGNHYGDD